MKNSRIGRMKQLLAFYVAAILLVTAIACFFSYEKQKAELLADMDATLLRMESEYAGIVENFWDIYLPVFEIDDGAGLRQYFRDSAAQAPYDTMQLRTILQRMAQRDDRIRWIALYAPARSINYIFYRVDSTLKKLPDDFLYLAQLENKCGVFEIYGEEDAQELVLAGGPPLGSGNGSILVAFDTSALHQLAERGRILPGLRFGITWQQRGILKEPGMPAAPPSLPNPGGHGMTFYNRDVYVVSVCEQTPQASRLYYSVPCWQILFHSHRHTPVLLFVVAVLMAVSLTLYRYVMKDIDHEVGMLRSGLEELGKNHLEYRLPEEFCQPDFAQIAAAVNAMAGSLKSNIDRVQEYQQKQREAEMQELQAKFNPHFLYNSLEMFRARCYENGDDETADLIADTAAIFCGFISPRTFIPLREEMAFSRRYLSLFRALWGVCGDPV